MTLTHRLARPEDIGALEPVMDAAIAGCGAAAPLVRMGKAIGG